ncbi:MAG: hypothetical protein QXT43_03010 [Candidatus Micrarchaeaceae archaeon]
MNGELIKLYLFDFASELQLEQIKNLFKGPEDFSKLDYNLPTPEEIPQFTLPLVFNMKDADVQVGDDKLQAKVQVAVFSPGTVSVRVRMPINEKNEQFLAKLAFSAEFENAAYKIAQHAKGKVKSAISKQFQISESELFEAYTFCFINDTKASALRGNKALIAGILVSEPNASGMDNKYMDEILGKSVSYYSDDAFFVGWDGAVLIDILKSIDYELLMAEIANMQLLKLRIYKQLTSSMLAKTGADAESLVNASFMRRVFSQKPMLLGTKLSVFLDSLNEMLNRIDNTVFGLGEWYLSRVYALFASVFKLRELREAVENEAGKLAARKSMINEIMAERRGDMLELVIILLIAVEILLELAYLAK